jgi:hypothetical protein
LERWVSVGLEERRLVLEVDEVAREEAPGGCYVLETDVSGRLLAAGRWIAVAGVWRWWSGRFGG